jgi:hypothetical protein
MNRRLKMHDSTAILEPIETQSSPDPSIEETYLEETYLEKTYRLIDEDLLPWTALQEKYPLDREHETMLEDLKKHLREGMSLERLLLFHSCAQLTILRVLLHFLDREGRE